MARSTDQNDILRHFWKQSERRQATPFNVNAAEWPPQVLKEEIKQYGAERVWAAGIKALGYPPTWTTGESEVSRILGVLELGD